MITRSKTRNLMSPQNLYTEMLTRVNAPTPTLAAEPAQKVAEEEEEEEIPAASQEIPKDEVSLHKERPPSSIVSKDKAQHHHALHVHFDKITGLESTVRKMEERISAVENAMAMATKHLDSLKKNAHNEQNLIISERNKMRHLMTDVEKLLAARAADLEKQFKKQLDDSKRALQEQIQTSAEETKTLKKIVEDVDTLVKKQDDNPRLVTKSPRKSRWDNIISVSSAKNKILDAVQRARNSISPSSSKASPQSPRASSEASVTEASVTEPSGTDDELPESSSREATPPGKPTVPKKKSWSPRSRPQTKRPTKPRPSRTQSPALPKENPPPPPEPLPSKESVPTAAPEPQPAVTPSANSPAQPPAASNDVSQRTRSKTRALAQDKVAITGKAMPLQVDTQQKHDQDDESSSLKDFEAEVNAWSGGEDEPEPCPDSFHQMLHCIIIHLRTKTIQTHTELSDMISQLSEVVRLHYPTDQEEPDLACRQAQVLKLITCFYQTVCLISMEQTIPPENVYANEELLLLALHRVHAML